MTTTTDPIAASPLPGLTAAREIAGAIVEAIDDMTETDYFAELVYARLPAAQGFMPEGQRCDHDDACIAENRDRVLREAIRIAAMRLLDRRFADDDRIMR